jgi:hypothetical protein
MAVFIAMVAEQNCKNASRKDEALRAGDIILGIDIEEQEVQLGEEMAAPVRERILRSGDEQLVRILRILPEESFARLKGILSDP